MHQSKGPARKASLLKKIILTKLQEDGDVRKHISDFSDAVKELSEIGVAINDEVLAIILMYSLPASFSMFRTAIESRDELPSTAVLKIKIIEDYEGRGNQPVEAGALYSKSNNKYYDKKRRENDFNRTQGHSQPSENRICYKCGKHGHIAKNCPKKKGKKPCHSSSQVENDAGSSPTTFMVYTAEEALYSERLNNAWCLDSGQCQEVVNNVEMESLSRKMIDIWHERLGHVNERDLKSMAKHGLVDGLKISDSDKLSECEVCAREKQACKPFPTGNQERTKDLLEIVHTDVCGPMRQ
ncbi:GSCOCG00012765001-RA-CDS, partial [Cotesia congregata]